MKSPQINWNPSDRQLRQFGLTALLLLPLLTGLWTAGNVALVLGAAALGVIAAALGFLAPRRLKPPFLALSLLTFPLGILVHELSLILLFFGVFAPLGLLFRCAGRDSLQRQFDREATTYWQPKEQPTDVASYFRRW